MQTRPQCSVHMQSVPKRVPCTDWIFRCFRRCLCLFVCFLYVTGLELLRHQAAPSRALFHALASNAAYHRKSSISIGSVNARGRVHDIALYQSVSPEWRGEQYGSPASLTMFLLCGARDAEREKTPRRATPRRKAKREHLVTKSSRILSTPETNAIVLNANVICIFMDTVRPDSMRIATSIKGLVTIHNDDDDSYDAPQCPGVSPAVADSMSACGGGASREHPLSSKVAKRRRRRRRCQCKRTVADVALVWSTGKLQRQLQLYWLQASIPIA